jgi:Uma2 family endonuclease
MLRLWCTRRPVARLFLALHEHVSSRRLGSVWFAPLDVILDTERALIVQPDLLFVAEDRSMIVEDTLVGAPDLVVEVLSPHPRIGELAERIGWFASYGVRECWLVRQFERRIEVLTFRKGAVTSRTAFTPGQSIRSAVLPAFDRAPESILGW